MSVSRILIGMLLDSDRTVPEISTAREAACPVLKLSVRCMRLFVRMEVPNRLGILFPVLGNLVPSAWESCPQSVGNIVALWFDVFADSFSPYFSTWLTVLRT